MSTHLVELEFFEDDHAFYCTIRLAQDQTIGYAEQTRLIAEKRLSEDGRQTWAIDELFHGARTVIGGKLYPHHTKRYRETATTGGIKYELAGFMDDPAPKEPGRFTPDKPFRSSEQAIT